MSDHGGIEKGSSVSARQGRGTFCRLISLFLLATLTSGALGDDGVEADPFHVMVLHSYHQEFRWTDETQQGLEQGFAEAGLEVEWAVEYMDAKRHPGQELSPDFARLFAEKYSDWRPDVIISCDDDALQFLIEYRERLFPGVPVVFCGLNVTDYDPQMLAGMAGYTGVVKRLDYTSTVDLILDIHPDVKRLICIHDRTTQGLGDRTTLERMAEAYAGRLEFVFPDTGKGLSEAELLDYLRSAGDDAAGLFLGFFRDRTGEAFELHHIIRTICEASPVPVYTVADAYLGPGTVGGKLLSGEKMGHTTALMAARLLQGESVSQVPIAIEPLNQYMFDDRQLKRFDISRSRLPAGSLILYGSTSFYAQHRVAILWGLAGVIGLCGLTGMLLVYTVWRRRTERRLAASEAKYRLLAEHATDMLSKHDAAGRYTYVSPSCERLLGYAEEEMLGRGAFDFIFEDDIPRCRQALAKFNAGEIGQTVEYRLVAKDGRTVWVETTNRVILDETGAGIHEIVAVTRDVSPRRQAEQRLRDSEARHRRLVEGLPDIVYEFSKQRGARYWSPAVEAVLGYSYESLIDNPFRWSNAIHQDDQQRVREAIARALGGGTFDIEYRIMDAGGEWHWLRDRLIGTRRENGETIIEGLATDITARKQADEKLRQGHADLELAQEIAAIGNWSLDPAVGVSEWSDEVYRIYERDPALGPLALEDYRTIYSGSWFETFHRHIEAAIQDGTPYSIELRLDLPSGKVKWVQSICRPEPEPGPKGHVLRGTIQDITQSKHTAEALRASQQMLDDAERLTHVGGWVWHVQEDRWEFSENWLAIHGCITPPTTSEELLLVAHPDDRQWVREVFEGIMAGETDYNIELRIVRPDNGEMRYIHALGEAELDEHGRVVRLVGAGADVTELKRATDSLQASQQMLADAERLACVGGWAWHVQEDRWEFSENWMAIHGCSQPPTTSEELMPIAHPDDRERIGQAFEAMMAGQACYDLEHRIIRQDTGEVRYVHARGEAEFDKSGKVIRVVGAGVDVTDVKQAQAQREALEAKLLEAHKLQAVGRLAGGVAHDFNNKLQTILGYVNLLLMDLPANSAYREDLEMIRDAATQSADLTKQLLAFAQRQTAVAKPLDINEFIADKWTMLESIAGERIAMSWQPGMGIGQIKADPAQIEHVLVNLITNAREAIDTVGHITLATACVPAADVPTPNGDDAATHAEAYVCLRISDDGRGMDKEILEQLFEPFYSTKDRAKGAGLGLATVYGIVTQNKGYVDVESCPHRGTTFRIFLPASLAPKMPEPVLVADPVEAYETLGTVLLVEDEASILRLCRKVVDGLGYETLAASSPAEALAIISEPGQVVDLLISDVVMPNMTGTQLRKAIEAKTGPLPCIFMSGYVQEAFDPAAGEQQTRFIAKPFSLPQLQQLVRDVMSNRRREPEIWRSDDTDTAYE